MSYNYMPKKRGAVTVPKGVRVPKIKLTPGKTMRKPRASPTMDKIVELANFGYAPAEIAERLDRRLSNIKAQMDRAVDLGRIPGGKNLKGEYRLICGAMEGLLVDELHKQDPEFITWLKDNIPEGGTVMSFLVSCAIDAWYEDQPE